MEMRQVVTGTLAWAGLVVVVAVPATEALVSHLAQPQAGQAIETVAPIAAPVAAQKPSVTPQTASVSATAQILPPVQPKPVVARLRPNPKPAVQPAPVFASTTAVPVIKPVSVEKPLPQFSPARLETSNAEDRVTPPVESKARELPARIADLPARPKSNAAPAISAIAPAAKLAPSLVDKPVVEASAAGADLPPVAPAATPKVAVDSPPASAVVAAPSEVHVATTGAENVVSASPDAAEPAVAAPPAAPPVPMPVSARPKEAPAKLVTADDLKGWKSGSLADYLKQQGLASSGATSPGDSN